MLSTAAWAAAAAAETWDPDDKGGELEGECGEPNPWCWDINGGDKLLLIEPIDDGSVTIGGGESGEAVKLNIDTNRLINFVEFINEFYDILISYQNVNWIQILIGISYLVITCRYIKVQVILHNHNPELSNAQLNSIYPVLVIYTSLE